MPGKKNIRRWMGGRSVDLQGAANALGERRPAKVSTGGGNRCEPKKWWGKRKAAKAALYTHIVVPQMSKSGKVIKHRIPLEHWDGVR